MVHLFDQVSHYHSGRDLTYMRLSNLVRAPDLSRQQITLGSMAGVVTVQRDLVSAYSLGLMIKYANVLEYWC